jgi:hypothetical protein
MLTLGCALPHMYPLSVTTPPLVATHMWVVDEAHTLADVLMVVHEGLNQLCCLEGPQGG